MKADYLKSVTRALNILEYLAENRETGVTQISQKLNLPKSTVHRLLSTLSSKGYVKQEPSAQKYALGLKIFEVGSAFLKEGDLHSQAIPVMRRLVKEYNLTAHLGILDKELGEIIYVHTVESDNPLRVYARVGRRSPVHCTALGKVLLSSLDEKEQERIVAKRGLPKFSETTITTREELKKELAQIKKQGYGLDRGEGNPQIRCAATLIRGVGGEVIAAMSLSGLSQEKPFKQIKNLANKIKEAGEEISCNLGYQKDRL